VAALPPAECSANRLRIVLMEGAVLLRAESSDGRVAERAVQDPSQLSAVALGLVASIPPEPAPPVLPPAPPALVTTEPERAPPPVVADASPSVASAPAPPEANILAIGVGGGARLAEPTHVLVADFELRADFPVGRWILLAAARFAPFSVRVEGEVSHYAYDELALGAGVGRRFSFGPDVVDLSTMPTVVVADEEALLTGAGGDPDSLAYLRWQLCARWLFARAGSWRLGTALDIDVAPTALDKPIVVAPLLPPIPTWTIGVHFAASGELQ
jgi:hypothetical protein